MICSGCGLQLPVSAARGRPARFHGAACRQRARRARLVNNNTELLAAVTAVETAVSEVRRMVLAAEQLPEEAGSCLRQTAAELAERLRGAGAAPCWSQSRPLPPHRMSQNQSRNQPLGETTSRSWRGPISHRHRGRRRRFGDLAALAAPRGHVRRDRWR